MNIDALRQEMLHEHIDAIIISNSDPHGSEYVAPHWQGRRWITGFTGSAGTAVVTADEAALWTDSRYFLQAEEQLQGTGFTLMKDGMAETPSITEWLLRKLSTSNGRTVAIDGMVTPYADVVALEKAMRRIGVTVRTNYDPLKMLWKERPALPSGDIYAVGREFIGETTEEKLQRIRCVMEENHQDAYIITDLMEIAWTLNLRGSDIAMTPVFIANLFITHDAVWLFHNGALTPEAQAMTAGMRTMPYGEFVPFLRKLNEVRMMCDSTATCYTVYNIIKNCALDIPSPVTAFKAVKNEREIKGFRNSMLRDGVAMVRFLRWLRPAVEAGGQTEMSVSDRLEQLRRESPECKDLSFGTICGYNAHGAIVHYSATPDSDAPLKPEGLLLVDSGAQYVDGTTDITRTIALGPVTAEMKRVYTYVLKANIAMATSQFPRGVNGTQIDAVARSVAWQGGYNYMHGTGHGVGWRLCVHEGPQRVALSWNPCALQPGMTITDEPGIYLAGKFGVRTENMMLIVPVEDAGKDGETEFLRMEPLTLCPIDTTPIDLTLLTDKERAWLNAYHAHVRKALMPLLKDEEDRRWLTDATAEV